MIQTLFSEVFAKDEWLKVWDHILANDVSFFYFVVVAYLHHNRASLLRLKTVDECKYFFSRANPVNINLLLGDAYRLMKKTPKSFAPIMKPFHAVDRGHYPVFNAYPEYIVNYQKKLREKIRMEEEDYLRKK